MDQKKIIFVALAGAAMTLPASANAAPVANPNGSATVDVVKPLAVVEVADLDFGTVVSSAADGSVFLPADGSAPVYSGGAVGLPTDPLFRGEFLVVGLPGTDVIVTHSWPAKLDSIAGDQIDLQIMYLEGSTIKTLDPVSGETTLFFGGTIFVPGGTPEGDYENTFTVTVEYR